MKAIVKSISFEKDVLEWIDSEAKRRRSNRSQIIREAIGEAMVRETAPPENEYRTACPARPCAKPTKRPA